MSADADADVDARPPCPALVPTTDSGHPHVHADDDAYCPPTLELELEERFERKQAEKERAKAAAEKKLASRLQVALTVLFALVFLGANTLIFVGVERQAGGQQWGFFDAIWFLVITTTTTACRMRTRRSSWRVRLNLRPCWRPTT